MDRDGNTARVARLRTFRREDSAVGQPRLLRLYGDMAYEATAARPRSDATLTTYESERVRRGHLHCPALPRTTSTANNLGAPREGRARRSDDDAPRIPRPNGTGNQDTPDAIQGEGVGGRDVDGTALPRTKGRG